MIKNAEIAADVSRILQNTFTVLGESLRQVSTACSEAETSIYRKKIGDIFYIIVFGLLEPLYEEHPQLKPSDWEARDV